MKNKKAITHALSLITLAIGLYMIVSYGGNMSPPTLSGIAFSIIGIRELIK